jgi:hypothetical protein
MGIVLASADVSTAQTECVGWTGPRARLAVPAGLTNTFTSPRMAPYYIMRKNEKQREKSEFSDETNQQKDEKTKQSKKNKTLEIDNKKQTYNSVLLEEHGQI